MANTFYTAEEAAAKLNKTIEELTQLAREGKLREFRDAGKVSYKVEEVDALALGTGAPGGGSASGEVVLEPAEDSSLEIAMSGSDVLSLEQVEEEDAAAETKTGATDEKKKEGTVVPSVGISVFDDDELDEAVDPLAQTQVTDAADMGLEGVGSGSGILDLTRESDDTSLGAELLDEIAPGGDDETLEMGEATRAGLEEAIGEEGAGSSDVLEPVGAPSARPGRAVAVRRVEYGPDATSSALTALMAITVLVLLIGGLAAAAMVREVWPMPLPMIAGNMPAFAGGAAGVAVVAAVITYFVSKRSGG